MAKRLLDTKVWNEKFADKFTSEEKYFWLWLLTNPHNNLCGVSNVGLNGISSELAMNKEEINVLLDKFENKYGIIKYNEPSGEILNLKFKDYFWTTSADLKNSLEKQLQIIETTEFKDYIMNEIDKVKWVGKTRHTQS